MFPVREDHKNGSMARPQTYQSTRKYPSLVSFTDEMMMRSLAQSTRDAYAKVIKGTTSFLQSLNGAVMSFPISPRHECWYIDNVRQL